MAKITLNNLPNLNNPNTAVTTINNNSAVITTAFDNTLSRDGTSPNQMGANLDMNSWHILNLPEPSSDNDPIRKIDLTNVSQVTNLIHTASSTSNTIGLGTKTFTVPSGLGFFPGQFLLIQDAASTSNYMIARVTSYSGTTLIVNSLNSAGAGTKTSWTIDLSGPQGPVFVEYDTVVNASAATIDPTVTFLKLSGYYAVGDGGNGLYMKTVSVPAHAGYFTSVGGLIWELVSDPVTPEMFGCRGDGLTDDRAKMQSAMDFVSGRGGGVVSFTPNKDYRIIINLSTPNFCLTISDYVEVHFNGSNINLEIDNYLYGVRPKSYTKLIGPGKIEVTVATGIPSGYFQNSIQSPLTLGSQLGDLGTVVAKNPYAEVHDWVIDGITFKNNVTLNKNSELVCGNGGPYNGVVRNCTFVASDRVGIAIGFDWAFYGTLISSDINLSRANYNAGTAYSIHPHHIVIENNHIQEMSEAFDIPQNFGSHGIRLSGIYDFDVRDNTVDYCTYAGIFITGGDLSFEFAPAAVRINAMINISVTGNNCKLCDRYGFYFEAFPDNVWQAAFNPLNPSYPYAPIGVVDGYQVNAVCKNNIFKGNSALLQGIFADWNRGLTIENNKILQFDTGILLDSGSNYTQILNNDVSLSSKAGINVSGTTHPTGTIISHNKVYRNVLGGGTTFGNIYINLADDTIIDNNQIGFGEDFALNGVVVTDNALRTTIINNRVYAVNTGGTAYKMATSSANGLSAIWVFRDNYFSGTGSGLYISGLQIMPYRRDINVGGGNAIITHCINPRGALTSDITPSFGTWSVGSTCLNLDSVTGQSYSSKCTAAGSPGTWKSTSVVA